MLGPVSSTLIPVGAALAGSVIALKRQVSETFQRAVQHLAAGVVFAAAAVEILPMVKHQASLWATAIGGIAGVLAMLGLRSLEERWKQGPVGLLAVTGIDLLVDGLVLGLAFVAGARAGILLTVALTLEVMFLAIAITTETMSFYRSAAKTVIAVGLLMLLLPLGAAAGVQVANFSPAVVAGFLTFGLVALLYLVTEELLVEAHQGEEGPFTTALFFVGFLALLLLEEAV